jgi:hypothetical protein
MERADERHLHLNPCSNGKITNGTRASRCRFYLVKAILAAGQRMAKAHVATVVKARRLVFI